MATSSPTSTSPDTLYTYFTVLQLYFSTPRCVSKEVCARKDVTSPRQDLIFLDATLLQHALAEDAECSNDNSQICCHQEDITPERDCSFYVRDSFKCVKRTECLDKLLDSSDDGIGIDLRQFQIFSGFIWHFF
jgi:hypothetical protein